MVTEKKGKTSRRLQSKGEMPSDAKIHQYNGNNRTKRET